MRDWFLMLHRLICRTSAHSPPSTSHLCSHSTRLQEGINLKVLLLWWNFQHGFLVSQSTTKTKGWSVLYFHHSKWYTRQKLNCFLTPVSPTFSIPHWSQSHITATDSKIFFFNPMTDNFHVLTNFSPIWITN